MAIRNLRRRVRAALAATVTGLLVVCRGKTGKVGEEEEDSLFDSSAYSVEFPVLGDLGKQSSDDAAGLGAAGEPASARLPDRARPSASEHSRHGLNISQPGARSSPGCSWTGAPTPTWVLRAQSLDSQWGEAAETLRHDLAAVTHNKTLTETQRAEEKNVLLGEARDLLENFLCRNLHLGARPSAREMSRFEERCKRAQEAEKQLAQRVLFKGVAVECAWKAIARRRARLPFPKVQMDRATKAALRPLVGQALEAGADRAIVQAKLAIKGELSAFLLEQKHFRARSGESRRPARAP